MTLPARLQGTYPLDLEHHIVVDLEQLIDGARRHATGHAVDRRLALFLLPTGDAVSRFGHCCREVTHKLVHVAHMAHSLMGCWGWWVCSTDRFSPLETTYGFTGVTPSSSGGSHRRRLSLLLTATI